MRRLLFIVVGAVIVAGSWLVLPATAETDVPKRAERRQRAQERREYLADHPEARARRDQRLEEQRDRMERRKAASREVRVPTASHFTIVPIRYDTGAPADTFLGPLDGTVSGYNSFVGNRFTTNSGSSLASGSVTGGSVFAMRRVVSTSTGTTTTTTTTTYPTTFTAAVGFFNLPTTPGTGPAPSVITVAPFTGPITRSTFVPNVFLGAVPVPGSGFLAGMRVLTTLNDGGTFTTYDSVGMVNDERFVPNPPGAPTGLGFHGFQIGFGFTGTTPPAQIYQPLPAQNAMLRLSGALLVPVELMDFEVE